MRTPSVPVANLTADNTILVSPSLTSPTCEVTVRLSDGEMLVATLEFARPGSCTPYGNAVDASMFAYVDAGAPAH
jgi:hypothetical protein